MNEVTGFSILFAVVGLLFIGLSIPLVLGRVPPNPFYGCRTTKTLADSKPGMKRTAFPDKDFLIAGVFVFAASLVALRFGQGGNPTNVVITLLSVLVLAVAGAAWHCFTIGKRA